MCWVDAGITVCIFSNANMFCLECFLLLICVFCNVASAQASDQPYWRPDPADQRYARDIMDLTYFGRSKFQRHARQRSSRRRQGGGGSHVDDEWRRRGEELLANSPGNWKHRTPIHWCRLGCTCLTREDAVDKMHGLITDVVFNNETGQPADNKWMSVFPCLQDLGLGQIFYGVLPFVEAYLNGEHAAADGPLPDDFAIDQDWATARKAYARRAARLIHSATAAPRLLFALGTLGPLMHGHASLFKRGTNQQPSGAKPSIGTEASDIFDFADLDRSPLVPIFAQLCDYLMDAFHSASSEKFWRPVIRAASDDGRLPQDMLWLFRSVLCKVISGMYRR